MTKGIRIALATAAFVLGGCLDSNLPSPHPVAPPADAADEPTPPPAEIAGKQRPPSQEELETQSSGLHYGDPYALQGIDEATTMGGYDCYIWIPYAGWTLYHMAVFGKFEMIPDDPDPNINVQHYKARFHGVTYSQSYPYYALTIDGGDIRVKESGYQTLVGQSAGQGAGLGPEIYQGNGAYPWQNVTAWANLARVTVYSTVFGGRGFVTVTAYPFATAGPASCGSMTLAWWRTSAIPGGGGGGGSCPGGPC